MEVEEHRRFLKGELEHFADIFSLPINVSEIGAIAQAAAVVARQVRIRHEGHFEFNAACPLTRLTAATRGVERKARGREAAQLRFGQRRKKLTDQIENSQVRGGP